MVVRVDRRADRHLGDHAEGVHLERCADGSLKPFDQQRRIAPDQEPSIGARLQAFPAVGNRGVHAVPDLAHQRKTFIDDRLLRDAGIVGHRVQPL